MFPEHFSRQALHSCQRQSNITTPVTTRITLYQAATDLPRWLNNAELVPQPQQVLQPQDRSPADPHPCRDLVIITILKSNGRGWREPIATPPLTNRLQLHLHGRRGFISGRLNPRVSPAIKRTSTLPQRQATTTTHTTMTTATITTVRLTSGLLP